MGRRRQIWWFPSDAAHVSLGRRRAAFGLRTLGLVGPLGTSDLSCVVTPAAAVEVETRATVGRATGVGRPPSESSPRTGTPRGASRTTCRRRRGGTCTGSGRGRSPGVGTSLFPTYIIVGSPEGRCECGTLYVVRRVCGSFWTVFVPWGTVRVVLLESPKPRGPRVIGGKDRVFQMGTGTHS